VVVLLIAVIIIGSSHFPIKLVDFSVYWSAGSLLLGGGNPYNPDQILIKQQANGPSDVNADMLLFWYPPWSLPLSIVVGALSYQTSQLLWYLLSIGAICYCATTLWQQYHGGEISRWFAWFLVLTFTPAWFALFFGQVSPLILIGITGFLALIQRRSPKADLFSGLFLGLLAIKPTLLYLFWPALLLWIYTEHRYRVLAGLSLTIVGGTLVSMIFRPGILLDYMHFIQEARVIDWKVPTIGFWLRHFLAPNLVFVQFIPSAIGLIWLLFHWLRHRRQWDWLQQISWISFLSLITTAFAWSHDQVILIPALIEAAVLIRLRIKSFQVKIILLIVWLGFSITIFIVHLSRDDSWFVWQAPVMLLAYALTKHYFSSRTVDAKPELLID
jgi:hypothetical protein